MSKWYPCVYCTEDLRCEKYSGDGVISYCVLGPCTDETHSNADRIRGMSDEELAEMLETINSCTCSFFMGKSPCDANDCPCWLSWLKEEAKT